MSVSSKFRLRNVGYPRWVRQNKISIENVLETVDKLFRARTDNHLKRIDWCLGILFVPFGDRFSESWEPLDMEIVFLIGIFGQCILHGLGHGEGTLTESKFVNLLTVLLKLSLKLCHE